MHTHTTNLFKQMVPGDKKINWHAKSVPSPANTLAMIAYSCLGNYLIKIHYTAHTRPCCGTKRSRTEAQCVLTV